MKALVWMRDYHIRMDYVEEGLAVLRDHFDVDVVVAEDGKEDEALREVEARLPRAEALVMGPWYRPQAPEDLLERAPVLKVVSGTFDNRFLGWLDFDRLAGREIVLIDTSRSMTPTVAEFALAMTLNLIRDIPANIELVRRGEWKPEAAKLDGYVYGDLTGRRVGLAGFGSINRRYAELLTPFRPDLAASDPFVPESEMAKWGAKKISSLAELAARSEIFVVGIPPTPSTLEIVDDEVIGALAPGSLIIVVTRMAVIKQSALWDRIEKGEIRAAIDVFNPEPPPADAWFRRHPNVLPTPHIAGDTVFCHRRCFTEACVEAVAAVSGKSLRYQATRWDDRVYKGESV